MGTRFSFRLIALSCLLLANLQALPSHAESRLCNEEEQQAQILILNQLRGAKETYEGIRLNFISQRAALPEVQRLFVSIQKKFDANEPKYSALLKEIKKLEPSHVKARQRWDSYNAKLQPSLSRYDSLIAEFNRLITEFKKQQVIKEYQLTIALKYGDSLRANQIRADISDFQDDINTSNANIKSLNRDRNSIYTTAQYKIESKAFSSVSAVYQSKTAKLNSFKVIRQQFFTARSKLKQTKLVVDNGPNNLKIAKAEKDELSSRLVEMEGLCQLPDAP